MARLFCRLYPPVARWENLPRFNLALPGKTATLAAHFISFMSDSSEPAPAIDLSDLRLMPAWVADFSKSQPAHVSDDRHESHDRPRRDRDDRGFRGDDRRSSGGGNARSSGPRPGGGRPPAGGPRGQRDDRGQRGERWPDRRDGFSRRDDRPQGERFEAPPVVQGLTVTLEPEPKAVEAMAQMIRTAGKSYSVFDAAKLVLASGDRFRVGFALATETNAKFSVVPSDSSIWTSRDEAMAHLIHSDVLIQYYRQDEIELEEPKGNFTSIAICGMSGELLGPPSHHSYQSTLHKIHRERFFNLHIEDYKRRIRTDNSPEIIEKWKDSQKRGVQWIDLKAEVPEGGEAQKFKSRAEMESHFRAHHAEALISEAAQITVAGNIPKKNLSPGLYHALRKGVDEARKHLLPTAQQLCGGFEKQGLKLFKRRGGKLWVSRVRPRLLDSTIVLSDRIAKMLEVIKAKPGIKVKQLLEAIAPAVAATKTPALIEEAQPVVPPTDTSAPAPVEASSEQLQALQDIHWLNSEGYVIEYSDGIVFIGVTEPPPAKPKPAKEAPASEAPGAEPTEPVALEKPPAEQEATASAASEDTSISEERSKRFISTGEDFMIDPPEEAS